jgi:hypothetical protein
VSHDKENILIDCYSSVVVPDLIVTKIGGHNTNILEIQVSITPANVVRNAVSNPGFFSLLNQNSEVMMIVNRYPQIKENMEELRFMQILTALHHIRPDPTY